MKKNTRYLALNCCVIFTVLLLATTAIADPGVYARRYSRTLVKDYKDAFKCRHAAAKVVSDARKDGFQAEMLIIWRDPGPHHAVPAILFKNKWCIINQLAVYNPINENTSFSWKSSITTRRWWTKTLPLNPQWFSNRLQSGWTDIVRISTVSHDGVLAYLQERDDWVERGWRWRIVQ